MRFFRVRRFAFRRTLVGIRPPFDRFRADLSGWNGLLEDPVDACADDACADDACADDACADDACADDACRWNLFRFSLKVDAFSVTGEEQVICVAPYFAMASVNSIVPIVVIALWLMNCWMSSSR